ncbi:MAG: sensor histidine kinase [Planctomycetota bacterium]|jgi:signal transduction histidine kinase
MRGEVLAPFDRASELLSALVPALHAGDADGARAAILGSDLPTRELLDLALRARMGIRRGRGRPQERAERERAADAALRALADREDAAHPEDLDRRRQLATQHRRLLALLTDGVATVRPSGTLLHANRAAREALGLKLRELKDTPLESLFADRKEGAAVWTNLKRNGSLRAREVDRNPLNALFLNADLLEDELREADGVPGPIEEILAVMREEIERLNGVIKNYLSLSKLSSANFEKLDLNQVVTEFVEEAEEWAAAKKLSLDLRLNRGEVTMRGDRNMIRRVLVNLVQNALEVTPRGGKVVIGTRRLVHNVKLWVRDSGPGLSKEIEAQLFQPFFSTRERGTGLGLYLIREIVMAHEGRVALRSIKPRGAQATVLLPRWKEGAA